MRSATFAVTLLFATVVMAQEDPDTAITDSERLQLAQVAFRGGEFNQIRDFVEPLLVPTARIEDSADRVLARQLLAVGYFYDAQQVTTQDMRSELLARASEQFLEILRERPDFVLDPLLFPASVVELFERVLLDNADEINALRVRSSDPENGAVETFYVERRVQERNYVLNFAPFGIGQWQNDQQAKAMFFGVTQVLALGLNITSYIAIESLRGPSGYYDPGPDRRSGDYADALTWRNVMYGSASVFVALWAVSIIDSLIYFEASDVTIRALDAPPPELLPPREGASLEAIAPIGWSVVFPF